VFLEVNVEPFTSCCFGVRCRPADEFCGYPLPLIAARDLRVQEESVIAAVPRDVDEADQDPIAQPGPSPSPGCKAGSGPTVRVRHARHVTWPARSSRYQSALRASGTQPVRPSRLLARRRLPASTAGSAPAPVPAPGPPSQCAGRPPAPAPRPGAGRLADRLTGPGQEEQVRHDQGGRVIEVLADRLVDFV